MTSLTRAKHMTRLFGIGLGIAFVAFVAFRLVLGVVTTISTNKAQQTAAIANVAYGQIDDITLANSGVSASSATLSLDLVNGSFPQSSAAARIYKVATPALSLSAQDRARAKATNLGFTGEPTTVSPTTFIWVQNGRTLTVSLEDQTFTLSVDLASLTMTNRQSFTRTSPIGKQTAQLLQTQLLFTDIDYADPAVRFVNPVGKSTFMPQPEDATIPTSYAQITFFRHNLNDLPFYASSGKFGPITAITIPAVIPTTNTTSTPSSIAIGQLIDLKNTYLPIDKTDYATYPIINGSTAYALLRSNITKALVSVEPVNGATIPNTLISARVLFASLAYLEPDPNNPTYVQPIWLFEGRGTTDVGEAQWKAIVPAIDPDITAALLKNKK